jgi:hypothetical protein
VESLVTDVVSALDVIGQHTKGRPLKDRIEDLGRMLRIATSQAHDRAAERTHDTIAKASAQSDADVLRRAGLAAIATMGGKVPEDAGPQTIASTLRDLVNDSEEAGRDFAETQRKMQAEIDRLTDAAESAGASAVSEQARAERAEEERDEAQAALRAAKVLGEDGAPGESAADILLAAEMLRRWENGVTVEHDCGGSPTCPLCAAADLETVARCARGEHRRAGESMPGACSDPTSSQSFARAMAREEEDERPWHRDRAVVVRTPNRLDEEAARRAAKETEATLRERLSPAQPPPDQAVDEPAVGDGGSAP